MAQRKMMPNALKKVAWFAFLTLVISARAFALEANITCPDLDNLSSCIVSPSNSFSTEGIVETLNSINECKTNEQQTEVTCSTTQGIPFSCSSLSENTASCRLPDNTQINCANISDESATCLLASDDTLKDKLTEGIQTPAWRDMAIILAMICPTRKLTPDLQAECDRLISQALNGESLSDLLNQITPMGAASSVDATRLADEAHRRYIRQRIMSLRKEKVTPYQSVNHASSFFSLLSSVADNSIEPSTAYDQPTFSRVGSFFNGAVLSGDKANSNDELGSDWTTASFTGGIDYRLTNQFIYGSAFGYQQTTIELVQNRYQMDQTGYSASLYGSWFNKEGFYLESVLSYSGYRFNQDRNISYNLGSLNVSQLATSRYFSDKTSLTLGSGVQKEYRALSIDCYLLGELSQSTVDGYEEKITSNNNNGAGWALHYNDQSQDSKRLSLGTQISYALSQRWGVLQPTARIEFLHELETDKRNISGYFSGNTINPLSFSLSTNAIDQNYFQTGVGASMVFTANQSAFIFLESLLGHQTFSQTYLNAGWRWEL